MDDTPLPAARFDTRQLPPADQFAIHRELMSVCYDVTPLEARPAAAGFTAWDTLWDLGAVMLSEHRMDPQRLERSSRRAGVDGLDQYAVMLMEAGSVHGVVVQIGTATSTSAGRLTPKAWATACASRAA